MRLYFKLGKRLGATLRKLDYPTKNSLLAWCREFEQKQDLKKGYQREKWLYDAEDKRRAVEHYVTHGHCLAYTIQFLGGQLDRGAPDYRSPPSWIYVVFGRDFAIPAPGFKFS